MGVTAHIGTTLLFVATVLLLVVCLSSPLIKPLGFLTIEGNNDGIPFVWHFGAFGACTKPDPGEWNCTAATLGYNISDIITTQLRMVKEHNVDLAMTSLTKAMVLHPIACAFSGLGFIISACSNKFGFLWATLAATFAFILTVIAVIVDFLVFQIVRKRITENLTGLHLSGAWSSSAWLVVSAMVVLLIAQFFTFFQCCCGRSRAQKREADNYHKNMAYGKPGYA